MTNQTKIQKADRIIRKAFNATFESRLSAVVSRLEKRGISLSTLKDIRKVLDGVAIAAVIIEPKLYLAYLAFRAIIDKMIKDRKYDDDVIYPF